MVTATLGIPVAAIIDLFLQEHIEAVPVLQPTSRALLVMGDARHGVQSTPRHSSY